MINLHVCWSIFEKSSTVKCVSNAVVNMSRKLLRKNFENSCDQVCFFFLSGFFLTNIHDSGQQGKGETIFVTPLCHFHPLHRHLDISRAITVESSPLEPGTVGFRAQVANN